MSSKRVPKLLEAVLRTVLARDDRTYILGDVAEEYRQKRDAGRPRWRADLWYLKQVMQSLRPSLRRRLEARKTGPGVSRGKPALLAGIGYDLRMALRGLSRNRGFALTAVLTAALGIGGATTIFSVVNAVLLRPLPYPEPQRLVRLYDQDVDAGLTRFSVSVPHYFAWKEQNSSFQAMGAYREDGFNLLIGSEPDQVGGVRMTASLFRVLGVNPIRGRWFSAAEDVPGAAKVAVISHALWRIRFSGDGGEASDTLVIDGHPHSVVGVMPPDFVFPQQQAIDVMVPFALEERPGGHFLRVLGRLNPHAELSAAALEMDALTARLGEHEKMTVFLIPLLDVTVEPVRDALYLLLAAVGLVLLLACVNVANLLLLRGTVRGPEIALRAALGAQRLRIVRQSLLESLLLGLGGGLLGTLLAWQALGALLAIAPSGLPRTSLVALDGQALAFSASISLASGLLFGLLPALRLSRPGLRSRLVQDGGRGGTSPSRLLGSLAVCEMALAMILMMGAGLLVHSLYNMANLELGYRTENVLTAQVNPVEARYPDPESRSEFYRRVVRETASIPGVQAAGLTHRLPLSGSSITPIQVEGRPSPSDQMEIVNWYAYTPGYLQALDIAIVRGRLPDPPAAWERPDEVIISQSLADHYFPDQDPVGKRVRRSEDTPWWLVVAVAEDVRDFELSGPPQPVLYLPYPTAPVPSMVLVLRGQGEASALTAALRRRLAAIEPAQPLGRVQTFEEHVASLRSMTRLSTWLMGLFAAVALTLALVGVYSVISFAVARKKREIAVRMALGANWMQIRRLVLGRVLRLAAASAAAGLAGGVLLSRLLDSLLFGVKAADPLTLAAALVLLAAVALAASYLPLRRVAKTDPMATLRCQ